MSREMKNRKVLLWILISFNSLFYVTGATFGPYINVYYRNHGLSITQIGILSTCGTMIALVMQPIWGMLADRKKKRVLVLRITVIVTGATVLLYYKADSFMSFLLCASIYTVFNCAINPMGDTVVIETACKYQIPYSVIRMGGTVSYAIAVVFAGIYLKKNPSASFGITAIVFLMMFCVTCFMSDAYGIHTKRDKAVRITTVLKNRGIIFVLLFCCVFQIALGCYNTFLGLLVTDLGYANNVIGMMFCISAISEIPVLLIIDKFMQKYKSEYIMLFAGFMMVIRIMLPAIGGNLISIIISQALQGVTYMIMYYCTVMYMNNHLMQEMHGTGQALLCVMQTGIASLFSNALGGYLSDHIGIRNTYSLYGIVLFLIVLSCVIVIRIYTRHN